MTRECVIVSPHFPPSTLAGAHRARHLAKHLPAHGWHPIVVRVDQAHYTERLDPELATLVPASVERVSTSAIPVQLTRLLGVGDIGLRAYLHIRAAVARIARERSPQIVLITGSPYYPMMLGGWIRHTLKIPVVLDFQDPWVSAEGAAQPRLSKGGVGDLLARKLEPRAVRDANFVTSVSEVQNKEMAARYPWLDVSKMAAIPIGGDPEDFDALRDRFFHEESVLEFAYVGTVWPRVIASVSTFLDSIVELRRSRPRLAERIRVRFYGTDASVSETPRYQIRPLAEARALSDIVEEEPRRLSFLDALRVMASSHAQVLLGSDEPHYTASKIYPALMAKRPFLSIFHEASSSHDILRRCGGGIALGFHDAAHLRTISPTISHAIATLIDHPGSLGEPDPSAYRPYTAYSVTGQFAEIFDQVSTPSKNHA